MCITEFGRLGLPLAALSGLLQRVQAQHGPLQGGSVNAGTVLRCDGGARGNGKESAVFISVPYLKASKLVVFTEKMLREKSSHPSRPLHQALSMFGGQTERDRDQLFLKYDGRRDRHVLWVNHVWAVMMGSGSLGPSPSDETMLTLLVAFLTYGDITEDDLCGNLMALIKDDASRASGGLSVEFQLPGGGVITFPVNPTTTYFVSFANTSAVSVR